VEETPAIEGTVKEHSSALLRPLGLRDLVLTQIVFVVGTSWVGTAAKLGSAHLAFWLLAIVLFYIPQAIVVIYLNRLMPLEGGLYQWAKFSFNPLIGFMVAWNLWMLGITVMALGGLTVTTNISYALGPGGSWIQESKGVVAAVSTVLTVALAAVAVRGLSLGKWVHNAGGIIMVTTYSVLILLPFLSLWRGDLKEYHPLAFAMPGLSLISINIFTKLAVGALSGFEYVAILAGECRAPAKTIGRSVLVAAPIIALMFIFGTSSVLAFTKGGPIDLIGPVPQALSLGFHGWPIVNVIVSGAIVLLAGRAVALTSIYLAGSSRLPMVAGWDQLLPEWFSTLHQRFRTPANSILFVSGVTLLFALFSLVGAHAQEAFQLVDNAATLFYGIAYVIMFAIPIFGQVVHGAKTPLWLRTVSAVGLVISLMAIFFTVVPIVDVESAYIFGAKILAVAVIANAIGLTIFLADKKRPAGRGRPPNGLDG
jgi:amino acid transporter